jgi:hypothetical protein
MNAGGQTYCRLKPEGVVITLQIGISSGRRSPRLLSAAIAGVIVASSAVNVEDLVSSVTTTEGASAIY